MLTRARATAFAAFAAGWSMMSLEILGGRLMAPDFGQTIYGWGALIGTGLGFMSAGYWLGGRLASEGRAKAGLPALLATAALLAAATPWLGRMVSAACEGLFGPIAGAIPAAAFLLGLPALALAAVSPLCVARLAEGGDVGRASGTVSALGSFGSIGGTFFAAFLAVPYMGLTAGYASAAVLAALAALATGIGVTRAAFLLTPLLLGFQTDRLVAKPFLEYVETPYNTVMVGDNREGTMRYLFLNTVNEVQSVRRRDGGATGFYYDRLPGIAGLTTGRRALFLGVAGGSGVEAMQRAWPDLQATGVEIDPGVIAVARRRFGLTIPVVAADARRFVENGGPLFDIIIVDLYATGQMPPHTVTTEFFAALAGRLAPGGVIAMNVLGGRDAPDLLAPLAATLGTSFPTVLATDAGAGNSFLLATHETMSIEQATARLMATTGPAFPAARAMATTLRVAETGDGTLFTDERSDVELRSARMLAALRQGSAH